jgi:MFS family permease
VSWPLGLTAAQIGWAASAYIAGAVLGALFFGRLADLLQGHPVLCFLSFPDRVRHPLTLKETLKHWRAAQRKLRGRRPHRDLSLPAKAFQASKTKVAFFSIPVTG